MKAGFSRVSISPPPGTKMMGVGHRDSAQGCTSIHDDVFVRALYCEHETEAALIMSFDLCFLGRGDCDRLKGALGRILDLTPRQILLSATHSHAGPSVGEWYAAGYEEPDRLYLAHFESAVLAAARQAKASAEPVTVHAGAAHSSLPMSRRQIRDGVSLNGPEPSGEVCEHLPLCLFQNRNQQPVCLLFSIATHPSIIRGWEITAEYPGVACDALDAHFGCNAALFLQGTGGDSKPRTIADGDEWKWEANWAEMEETGRILADEVKAALDKGLVECEPRLASGLLEMQWPLEEVAQGFFEEVLNDPELICDPIVGPKWAKRQLKRCELYGPPAASAPVLLQGIQLGQGLRLIAMEGEPVAKHGNRILEAYGDGVTFPLGYANGEAMYLPTSAMLPEGGIEVESYHQYGFPAPFAPGMEAVLDDSIEHLRRQGIM